MWERGDRGEGLAVSRGIGADGTRSPGRWRHDWWTPTWRPWPPPRTSRSNLLRSPPEAAPAAGDRDHPEDHGHRDHPEHPRHHTPAPGGPQRETQARQSTGTDQLVLSRSGRDRAPCPRRRVQRQRSGVSWTGTGTPGTRRPLAPPGPHSPFSSGSVEFRVEIGSRRPPDAVAAWKVIIPRTFNALRRPDRTTKPRNHADSHWACSCRSS